MKQSLLECQYHGSCDAPRYPPELSIALLKTGDMEVPSVHDTFRRRWKKSSTRHKSQTINLDLHLNDPLYFDAPSIFSKVSFILKAPAFVGAGPIHQVIQISQNRLVHIVGAKLER